MYSLLFLQFNSVRYSNSQNTTVGWPLYWVRVSLVFFLSKRCKRFRKSTMLQMKYEMKIFRIFIVNRWKNLGCWRFRLSVWTNDEIINLSIFLGCRLQFASLMHELYTKVSKHVSYFGFTILKIHRVNYTMCTPRL